MKLTSEQIIDRMKLYDEKLLPKGSFFPAMAVKKMKTGIIVRFRKLTGYTEPIFVKDYSWMNTT